MMRKFFSMDNMNNIITYLEKENIFYQVKDDQLNLFTNEKDFNEVVIIDFKNRSARLNVYFNDSYLKNIDGVELGWKPYGFSIRFFKDGTDISSNLFYNIKMNG